jgi:Protein of unknown function (DUF3168)
MTTVAELVFSALHGAAGVAALVDTRIRPGLLRQSDTLPAISYSRVSNGPQQGSSQMRTSRWQVDCWADSYLGAQAVAGAVKVVMEDHIDADQTPMIKYGRVVNQIDDDDPDNHAYRVILEVEFQTIGD